MTVLFDVVETRSSEPCNGGGGRGAGSGTREAKSGRTIVHLGLTDVQVFIGRVILKLETDNFMLVEILCFVTTNKHRFAPTDILE